MGLVARVGSVKPLADDRPLAGVSSESIARIAVEANSGLDHRDILVSHARLSPECYRCRSCCICLEHLLRREKNHVTIERVCFKHRLLIPRTSRLGSITLCAAQRWSRVIL